MEFEATEGYLLLADISGYTAFLTSTELEHSHAIIRELTSIVRQELVPPLRFVKLEGDAVLCYAAGAVLHGGERFIEVIEACYFAFSNRLEDIARASTCRCRACQATGSLDLKFLAHYGTFIVDREDGRDDLAGPDVILVHRLLKNTISDSGYALFTDACARRLPPDFNLRPHSESYESLGIIAGGVSDLGPRLAEMREARSLRLTAEDADFEIVAELPTTPALAWQYLVDPVQLQRWVCVANSPEPDVITPNQQGRMGAGATSHCNHGPAGTWFREFLAWSPFTFFTCRTLAPGSGQADARTTLDTYELESVENGTRLTHRLYLVDRTPEAVDAFRRLTPLLEAGAQHAHGELRRVIEEDAMGRPERPLSLGLDVPTPDR
ncbi:MAG: DUF2652 domain-containing protein [Actinomycetota bacterium]